MTNLTPILLALVILLFYFWAFFKNNKILRVSALTLIAFLILTREYMIESFMRSTIAARSMQGLATDDYKLGVHDVIDFCRDTRTFMFVLVLLFFALCLRGFSKSKQILSTIPESKAQEEELVKSP